MDAFNSIIGTINGYLWHDYVLYAVLAAGVIFTLWSGFSQWHALTHGVGVVRGKYSSEDGTGALTHFQALSAALSATVGLGNIAGVAIAITLGGPGAVFWMWVVGFLGMALKSAEVTLTMIHRNTDEPDNPHGGAMWVIRDALAGGSLAWFGKLLGGLFCVTVLVFAVAGGNMFQAWNVGDITRTYFGVPEIASGVVLAVLVAAVIIGGIKRIGSVAGVLVPVMCVVYLLAGGYVLAVNAEQIPGLFALIFKSAFSASEASGAFIGGTFGYAFLWGMKRALFSSEAGLGSAPMAHAAVKTKEPVREGVVAGLEPFIDTLVVCTMTALVMLSSGIWNRAPVVDLNPPPVLQQTEAAGQWAPAPTAVGNEFAVGDSVFAIVTAHDNADTGNGLHKLFGEVQATDDGQQIQWSAMTTEHQPTFRDGGVYANYVGATATAKAFDTASDGLGKWMVTIAVWLFAISTMISWSYYGEQGMVYLFGTRSVMPYRVVYCGLAVVACTGFLTTTTELGNFSDLGAGLMLVVNIPITLFLGHQAMRAYKQYISRWRAGEFER